MPPPSFALRGLSRGGVLAAVFLISAAMLGFQILQVVVLSLQLFPEAAFLVVSLSMLGLGCGGSLATLLVRRGEPDRLVPALGTSAVAFALAMPAAMMIASRLHGVFGLVLVSAVPYVFVGLFLSLLFATWSEHATEIYFADLLGAGVGCAAIVAALDHFADAGTVTIVLGAVAAFGAALVVAIVEPRRLAVPALVLVACVVALPNSHGLFRFGPAPEKLYGRLLAEGTRGGRIDRQAWNFLGRIDAFEAGLAVADYDFGRTSKDFIDAGCVFRLLFSNGYNWTYSIDFGGRADAVRPLFDRWVQRTPYLFTTAPDVLNLGSGGGSEVYLALANGARSATAVEINGLMIEATTRWYPNDWDGLWQRPEVSVHELDARTFVNTTKQRFDVVSLNAVDTAGTQSSLLSANFLYTREAFARYLRVLRPGGVIFLTRPREQLLRALTAAAAALDARGAAEVARHVVVLGTEELPSAAVYVDPLTADQVRVLQDQVASGRIEGKLQYAPETDIDSNIFSDYFAARRDGRQADYERRVRLRTDPATDDEPYFYQVEPSFIGSPAGRLLAFILLLVASFGLLLMFAPLVRVALPDKNRALAAHLVYFGCLGLGFMLVEIAVVQQFALVLGHPAYSVSVTLAGMLVCGGLGSLFAGSTRAARRAWSLAPALVGSAVCIAAYALLIPRLAELAPASLAARIALCLAVIAPGSFFMGMPFPLKLRSLQGGERTLIPWAWAVNGLASVAGSVLAIVFTMNFGFRRVLLLAAALYLLALVADRATTKTAREA